MIYKIMRVALTRCDVIVFDLWNYDRNTGYEIHITVSKSKRLFALESASQYIGKEYSIEDIDTIVNNIRRDNNAIYSIH